MPFPNSRITSLAGYLKKMDKVFKEVKNLPPSIKEAVKHGDFSHVTVEDIRQVNVSVLEYIPPKMMSKMNETVLENIIQQFLKFNLPHALGRLVEAVGNKLSPAALLDNINLSNKSQQSNEAAGVLLHSALSRLGDTGGITANRLTQLKQHDLLKHVPEEQLMRVEGANAARILLETLYTGPSGGGAEANEPDDKALIYKLLETQFGKPKEWSEDTIRTVAGKYLRFLPVAALKQLPPDKVSATILNLRDGTFESPLQAKTLADAYLAKAGFEKDEKGALHGPHAQLPAVMATLQRLGAFLNPALTNDSAMLRAIIASADKWHLPAPLQAVAKFLKAEFRGKSLSSLTKEDFLPLTADVLKNSPPELICRAMETQALDDFKLAELGRVEGPKKSGFSGNALFKALIAQLTPYVTARFKQHANSNKYDMERLPPAFVGGIGVKGIQDMDNHQLQNLLQKIKDSQVLLYDEQKALLLKRLRDESLLDGRRFPAEFSFLRPRTKGSSMSMEDLDGLPADSELRLAHGEGKAVSPSVVEADPGLVGTLSPKQVEAMELKYVPGILAAVRRSKDGPQPQTLQVLSKRFSEYLRLKSDEYDDTDDKKLLKHISAAEVSKLPASVLAYFVDRRQTSKLPAAVRKEIMIALGELSSKDRALIPPRTREEIILQGLDALDTILDSAQAYDVPELAAIGQSVADLPPSAVQRLNPVAFEQALDMIQGTTEEDGGLKQRACLSAAQRKAWRDKSLAVYGKPELWDPSTVGTLCCLLPLLTEDDLLAIDKASIVTCHCVSDAPPPPHLAGLKQALDKACERQLGKADDTKKVFERIRAEAALGLKALESEMLSRKKRAHGHSRHKGLLSCLAVRLSGNPSDFPHDTLASLPAKDMKNCLYELGSVRLGQAEARLLWLKLLQANDAHVKEIPVSQLRSAAYILNGISKEEVDELNFADQDVVAAFGRPLGLSQALLGRMASSYNKVRRPGDYRPEEFIILRNLLCGFDHHTLLRIVPEAFSPALPILRDLEPTCELTNLAALVKIATRENVFGDPANWTAADVRGVGILLKGLTNVKEIPPEAFLGLSPSVAGALSESNLAHLTKEQLSFFPKFAAQGMSEVQLKSLSSDEREALEGTIRGPLVTDAAFSTLPTPTIISTISIALLTFL